MSFILDPSPDSIPIMLFATFSFYKYEHTLQEPLFSPPEATVVCLHYPNSQPTSLLCVSQKPSSWKQVKRQSVFFSPLAHSSRSPSYFPNARLLPGCPWKTSSRLHLEQEYPPCKRPWKIPPLKSGKGLVCSGIMF